jgi:uncharacterized membrane protein (DUF485 family)
VTVGVVWLVGVLVALLAFVVEYQIAWRRAQKKCDRLNEEAAREGRLDDWVVR